MKTFRHCEDYLGWGGENFLFHSSTDPAFFVHFQFIIAQVVTVNCMWDDPMLLMMNFFS